MASGLYATITPLPFSKVAADEIANIFSSILNLRDQQGRVGNILDESYAKITEYNDISKKKEGSYLPFPKNLGSAWALECRAKHGFHYHTFSKSDVSLSFRRLLFFATEGFTAEFFPLDQTKKKVLGPMERFIFEGPSFAELEFNGQIVHRFRPINKGTLFAYSIHHNDISEDDHVASTQTHEVTYVEPVEIIEYNLTSPKL